MKERNNYIETDGLYWESDTHEWFHDKSTTKYCRNEDLHGTKLNWAAFFVRDKSTGEYTRVLMDIETNELIRDDTSLEAQGVFIDMMKASKRYDDENVEKEFELSFCEECIQMTNHLNGECQKCKAKKNDNR